MSKEPRWVTRARQDEGQKETLGPNDSPWIRRMLAKLGATWLLGQPWCGGAMAAWMRDCGMAIPKHWYRARDWLDWGVPLERPAHGCVVVFGRDGGGHVGLCVGRSGNGDLLILGGNQGNAVNIRAFPVARVLGYRWPAGELKPQSAVLAVGTAQATTGEA